MSISDRDLIDQLADIGDSLNGHSQTITAQQLAMAETLASLRGSIDVVGKNLAQAQESSRDLIAAIRKLTRYALWIAVASLTLAFGHLLLGISRLLVS